MERANEHRKRLGGVMRQSGILAAGALELDAGVAATVIVGGFMEGLIGPLSPLNAEFGAGAKRMQAVRSLAGDIADLCCAAVAARGATARPRTPTRHRTDTDRRSP